MVRGGRTEEAGRLIRFFDRQAPTAEILRGFRRWHVKTDTVEGMDVMEDTAINAVEDFEALMARAEAGQPVAGFMLCCPQAGLDLSRMASAACGRGWQALLTQAGDARAMVAMSLGALGPAEHVEFWGLESALNLAAYHGERGVGLTLLIERFDELDDDFARMLLAAQSQARARCLPFLLAGTGGDQLRGRLAELTQVRATPAPLPARLHT